MKVDYELAVLTFLEHKCIVKYLNKAYIVNGNEVWSVMEYMEGGTIADARSAYRMKEEQIAFVALQMLRALRYLHTMQIVHRDLKSSNVMMTIDGHVKLIDFGLACDLEDKEEGVAHTVGSPYWMAPEVIKGQPASYPVDIWSFGICLLELANGIPPYHGNGLKAMFMNATVGVEKPFEHPAKWSPLFHDFIQQCLRLEPSERKTAKELARHDFCKKATSRSAMSGVLTSMFLKKTMDLFNI
eukprot:TRINITY_DN16668_c0_g1_i1.p1 TRINITY_DN16668_c0_g1~~TRINITY_DN16668_c0_g1_i1.p1  ORF type:complete len:269 (+),score=72.09 TRINITY_DN16668_c0_g1_i1:84-809(+)